MRRFKSLAAMSLAAATVAGCLFMPAGIVKADGEGLEINEENFDDEIFIKHARGCDLNEDGYLSDEELGMAKIFVIQNTKLKSLKGIEHFVEGLLTAYLPLFHIIIQHNFPEGFAGFFYLIQNILNGVKCCHRRLPPPYHNR